MALTCEADRIGGHGFQQMFGLSKTVTATLITKGLPLPLSQLQSLRWFSTTVCTILLGA